MFKLKLLFVLSINFFCIVNARSVSLSQKELQSVGSVLKTALGHHLDKKLGFKITGTFVFEENSENPEDYDFTIELNDSVVPEGALSGNDVLNGLANGNGNDNGNNGNVFLQIFNGPVDGSFIGKPGLERTTENADTTSPWWTTGGGQLTTAAPTEAPITNTPWETTTSWATWPADPEHVPE